MVHPLWGTHVNKTVFEQTQAHCCQMSSVAGPNKKIFAKFVEETRQSLAIMHYRHFLKSQLPTSFWLELNHLSSGCIHVNTCNVSRLMGAASCDVVSLCSQMFVPNRNDALCRSLSIKSNDESMHKLHWLGKGVTEQYRSHLH